jgi:hypothetical protein
VSGRRRTPAWTVALVLGALASSRAGAQDESPTLEVRPGRKGSPKPAKAKVSGTTPRAPDTARAPTHKNPPVVDPAPGGTEARGGNDDAGALVGFAHGLADPPFVDRRRRAPRTRRPDDFGHRLRPGEKFRFDVTFAGNPAGLAEAEVVRMEADPRGGPPAGSPLVRIEGHARTSGVVSLLATVTDDMVTHVDATTGAVVSSVNVLHYSGWAPRKYKHRVTEQSYEGRGQVRIVDTKDDVPDKSIKRLPLDAFDALSGMAWVRSLRLEPGQSAKAHVLDGTTLLRIEIHAKGPEKLGSMPSIGAALGLAPTDAYRIDGTITRVDRWDQALPGKRVFKMRAWLSNDERRIPLVLESDMWVGAIRLELTAYDPPPNEASGPVGAGTSGGAAP